MYPGPKKIVAGVVAEIVDAAGDDVGAGAVAVVVVGDVAGDAAVAVGHSIGTFV